MSHSVATRRQSNNIFGTHTHARARYGEHLRESFHYSFTKDNANALYNSFFCWCRCLSLQIGWYPSFHWDKWHFPMTHFTNNSANDAALDQNVTQTHVCIYFVCLLAPSSLWCVILICPWYEVTESYLIVIYCSDSLHVWRHYTLSVKAFWMENWV